MHAWGESWPLRNAPLGSHLFTTTAGAEAAWSRGVRFYTYRLVLLTFTNLYSVQVGLGTPALITAVLHQWRTSVPKPRGPRSTSKITWDAHTGYSFHACLVPPFLPSPSPLTASYTTISQTCSFLSCLISLLSTVNRFLFKDFPHHTAGLLHLAFGISIRSPSCRGGLWAELGSWIAVVRLHHFWNDISLACSAQQSRLWFLISFQGKVEVLDNYKENSHTYMCTFKIGLGYTWRQGKGAGPLIPICVWGWKG